MSNSNLRSTPHHAPNSLQPLSPASAKATQAPSGYNPALAAPLFQPGPAPSPRRNTHGGCAWILPMGNTSLRQPQDGALTQSAPLQPRQGRPLTFQVPARLFSEPEDAHLSGSLRSLSRRVLGLNVNRPAFTDATLIQQDRYFAEPVRELQTAPLAAPLAAPITARRAPESAPPHSEDRCAPPSLRPRVA